MAKNIILKTKLEGAKKTKRGLKSVDGGLKSLGKSAMKVGGAFFAAQGIIRGFKSAIELAGIQEQVEKRLEVALGKTSQALLNQASALQKVTTFGDEAIIGVQASIAAFVKNEDQIKKATAATLDMAVAMGMDLRAAGDLIAKTLGSSTNALSRYGIQVEGAVGSSERLESLTKNIAVLFGGQATAQAETMAGALDQAGNAAGDLAEKIGDKLSPLVKALAGNFQKTAEQLSEMLDPTVISREGELNDLLKRRQELLHGIAIESKDGVVTIEEFFAAIEESRGVSEEELGMPITLLDEQINKYKDLLFAKQPVLDLMRTEGIIMEKFKKVSVDSLTIQLELAKAKQEQINADLKQAVLSGQTAVQAMKSVVRAETMEAVAGYISSVLRGTPYPLNIILAAGGGAIVTGLLDQALSAIPNKFAAGADFVTAGPTPMLVGEAGPERVQVSPLSGPAGASSGGVTINISGGVIDDDYVRNTLIPALNKATGMGARINA